MTSHKDKLQTINKGFSIPRNYYESSQKDLTNVSREKSLHRSTTENSNNDDDSIYREPISGQYLNLSTDKVTFDKNGTGASHKSLNRPTLQSNQPYNTSNSRRYITIHDPHTLTNNQLIYKSQSLNALKSKEPSKILSKSSIQQEYHDKRVQHHLRGISHGKAKRPCKIATAMFIIFALLFITGLTLICLTYIYKNINFSLDKGEMIGPVIMAGSFIFLGVGIKFIYDAHKMSRKERRTISYQGYDRRYVGLKSGRNEKLIANENIISGTATDIGLTRIPNKKQTLSNGGHTLGKSSQKVYGNLDDSSEI